ncbi:hypothetical protein GCK72_014129 [Caenorhabditis remanei]|uniref:Uncharacterized protein n=1 Tax=Caenorhabditis remanei TaxID=31234 RepID=A0A6A5GT13_CAERE|nr:hypothetical protein GCK72_014129 [Caenorhabditis remanei]KAF1757673.1 hypothetical protein GCK72_014129 [Caenorhabditis remanei]
MGSKHQIGILKRDGLGKQRFDMENILTRSLYRVLNSTTQVPTHVASKNQNVDKMNFSSRPQPIAVARPNNHQIGNSSSVDIDMQMKLLAQEICGRVERKYERKLDEVRERDRKDTERRLASIRSEFEAKYQLQLGKLEKEKNRLLDQISERERTLEHRMEMRSAEREHDLAAKQRTVENRAIELTLNKENFEKTKEEWQKRMEEDLEEMRLERERIEVAASKTTDRRRSEMAVEAEVSMWKKRTAELEHDANETRKRLGDLMEDNFRLKDQTGAISQVKRELDVTMTALNESREELAASKVEIRRTGDYDQMKEENDQLKIEIERIRLKTTQRVQSAVEETIAEYSAKEAKWKRIAGLSQQRIAVLTEKLKDLEIERDVLRQEIKTMQKMVGRGSSQKLQVQNLTKHQSKIMFRSVSPSESTSSLSDGELEILNIRQRIQNLDDIAKELDASVEHFSTSGISQKVFDKNESNVELYDDFCRALHRSVIDDEGSPINMTSSPQKPVKKSQKIIESPVPSEHDSEEKVKKPESDSWLKRGMRVVSPPARKKSFEEVRTTEVVSEKNSEQVRNRIEPVKPVEPELSEFEKRLQARGAAKDQTDRRNRILELATTPEPEPIQTIVQQQAQESEKPTSADNPMFAGVDPVMAEYMKKVLAARNQNPTTSNPVQPIESINQTPQLTTEPPRVREVEVTLADELDLELDQPRANADDDWW